MKIMKRLFWMAVMAAIGYFGLKIYNIVRNSLRLSKTLDLYLQNKFGEKPEDTNIRCTLRTMTLELKFSSALEERRQEIEDAVLEYIDDFYPMLANMKIRVTLHFGESDEKECCCCDCGEKE